MYSNDSLEASFYDPPSFMTQSFMGKSIYQVLDNRRRYTIGYMLITLTIFFFLLNLIYTAWYLRIAWISTLIVEIGNIIYIYHMNNLEHNFS